MKLLLYFLYFSKIKEIIHQLQNKTIRQVTKGAIILWLHVAIPFITKELLDFHIDEANPGMIIGRLQPACYNLLQRIIFEQIDISQSQSSHKRRLMKNILLQTF